MNTSTWVIVPAYNEEKYLNKVLTKLKQNWGNFIVVDDGSSDTTSQIALESTKHVLIHKINLGKGAALKTGCEYAFNILNAKAVIFFDGDDQHDPLIIKEMAKKLSEYPIVLGVRAFNNNMPLTKITFNRLASIITLVFFHKYIPDIPSGFKGLSKYAYQQVQWTSRDYLVEMEIAAKMAQKHLEYSTVSIPSIYHDRS